MMSDVQVFVMPDKNRVEVYEDGRVVYIYQDSQDPYPTEADISSTKLGGLLRGCLLQGGLLEAGSQGDPLNVTLCNVMRVMVMTNVTLRITSQRDRRIF